MKIKQFLSIILAFVAALTINVPAFAANPSVTETSTITTAGGTGNSSLMLTVEYPSGTIYGDTFSAIVPAVIPISGVTNSSEATCHTNAKIVNQNVERDIKVSGISMSADGGWSVVDYGTGDFETGKNVSMSFNGDKVGSDGNVALTASNWTIDAGSEKALALDAKISKQEIPMTTTKIATIGFTKRMRRKPTP